MFSALYIHAAGATFAGHSSRGGGYVLDNQIAEILSTAGRRRSQR